MTSATNHSVLIGYLKSIFPGSSVQRDSQSYGHGLLFTVETPGGKRKYLIEFAEEFLANNTPFTIVRKLGEWNLKLRTQKGEGRKVEVTGSGIRLAEQQEPDITPQESAEGDELSD